MGLSNRIDIATKLAYLLFGVVKWRKHPGCFERHLQRRYKSLFFPRNRRAVTLQEVDVARQKDDDEKNLFNRKAKTVSRLPEGEECPPQIIDNIRNIYRQLGDLIEESFSLGDSTLVERDQLLIYEKACLDFLLKHQPSQSESSLVPVLKNKVVLG